jgi:polyphosphate:AMP phosphotransferase
MLKAVDLSKKMSKVKLKKMLDASLGDELGQIQRDCRAAGMPVIMVFEGWRHSRRSDIINGMMQYMDARGFRVLSSTKLPTEVRKQPFFTGFWQHLPLPGGMAIYRHSWYHMQIAGKAIGGEVDVTPTTYEHINAFEKQLTDGHYCILKFFVHISHEQQKANQKKAARNLGKAWHETRTIYDEESEYNKFYKCYDEMLTATDTTNAPWHVVSGEDLQAAQAEIYNTIVAELRKALYAFKEDKALKKPSTGKSAGGEKYNILSKVKLNKTIKKKAYKDKLEKYQDKLRKLQVEAANAGLSTVIAFEGWDAGGKGGAIKRLTSVFDPLGYAVNPTSAPNAVEKAFHYLWRFWIHVPLRGEIAIFDRTWYGRVMVERVEHFTPDVDWQRAYEEINETEKQWTEANIAIAKFWLQIDKDEQERRFKLREANPSKVWKITDEDWRNRAKWPDYEVAVNEMIAKTSTPYAPWTIVEGDDKMYARLKVMKTVIDMLEKRLHKGKGK